MNPFVATSHFFQNHHTSAVVVTLTINNPNNAPMQILNAPGNLVTTLLPLDTITGAFMLVAGGWLHSQLPGQVQFQNIVLLPVG